MGQKKKETLYFEIGAKKTPMHPSKKLNEKRQQIQKGVIRRINSIL